MLQNAVTNLRRYSCRSQRGRWYRCHHWRELQKFDTSIRKRWNLKSNLDGSKLIGYNDFEKILQQYVLPS